MTAARVALMALVFVAACGDGALAPSDLSMPTHPDLGPDAGPPEVVGPHQLGPFIPAPHSPLPLLPANSGHVLSTVNLVTITYTGYPYADKVEKLGDFLFTSNWFDAVRAGYGVNGGAHVKKVRLPGPIPNDDDVAPTVIEDLIASGQVPAPTADPATTPFYLIYFPASASTVGCGKGYGGYHQYSQHGAHEYAYGVVVDCGVGVADITLAASHEIIEAATDPYLDGYYTSGFGALEEIGFGEVGDLCNGLLISEGGFAIQRSWSNAAAALGDNPCVPAPAGEVYYSVHHPVAVPAGPAGSQLAVTLTGWSLGYLPDWDIAVDSSFFDIMTTLSDVHINNGKTVTLTITVPAYAPGTHLFVTVTSSPRGSQWPIEFIVE